MGECLCGVSAVQDCTGYILQGGQDPMPDLESFFSN